eukprot:COSAG04_NODE_3532_length_2733_cov_1.457099_2_plen_119_part_00
MIAAATTTTVTATAAGTATVIARDPALAAATAAVTEEAKPAAVSRGGRCDADKMCYGERKLRQQLARHRRVVHSVQRTAVNLGAASGKAARGMGIAAASGLLPLFSAGKGFLRPPSTS